MCAVGLRFVVLHQSAGSHVAYGAGAFALNELLTGTVFVAFLLASGIYLFESEQRRTRMQRTGRMQLRTPLA